LAPNHALIEFSLARASKGMGHLGASFAYIQQAIAIDGYDLDARFFRATLAVEYDQWDVTLSDLAFLANQTLAPPQKLMLANLYLQTGQFSAAIPHYQTLTMQYSGYFEAWMGLATAFERANDLTRFESALHSAAGAVKNSEHGIALKQLQAKLAYRNKQFDEATKLLQDVWALPSSNGLWKSQVGFEYAQSLDKSKQYQAAWHVFNAAHVLRNELNQDSVGDQQALNFFGLLAKPLTGEWPVAHEDNEQLDPVFVVGFPRSGTTLLEQILDAQPGLVSFDEQPFLAKTLLQLQQMGLDYPAQLHQISQQQTKQLRQYYFQQAQTKVGNLDGRRLVDKNPLNWARLPLIRALFPNASVILALRHPCDVILSCYMQNLRSTVLSGAFSHFNRIADLYIALADYWQRIAPQLHMPVMISRYENLVQMPEQSTKQLAEFLGLPWSESWLNSASYAKHKAIIHTPSYAQVLEPLNTRALNRWQHYREFFDPEVMERLKPSVQAMGYQLDDC
jgi:tetratricopeptide (TPR) repeat protein